MERPMMLLLGGKGEVSTTGVWVVRWREEFGGFAVWLGWEILLTLIRRW